MSQSAAKKPVRTTITRGQFAPVEPNPAIRAITPTKTWASAVAANARAMP